MSFLHRILDAGLELMRLAVCLLIACWAGAEAINGLACQSWPQTEGTVTESTLQRIENKTGARYDAKIRYQYKIDGKTFVGERIQFGSLAFKEPTLIQAKYPLNAKVVVHYEKTNPATATLETGFNNLAVLPALVGAIALLIAYIRGLGRTADMKVRGNLSSWGEKSLAADPGSGRNTPVPTLIILVTFAVLLNVFTNWLSKNTAQAHNLTALMVFFGGLGLVMFFSSMPALIAHLARNRHYKSAGLLADFNSSVLAAFFPNSCEATIAYALQCDIAKEQLQLSKARQLAEKAIASGTSWLSKIAEYTKQEDEGNLTIQARKNSLNFQRAQCSEIVALCHHTLGEICLEMGLLDEAMKHSIKAVKLAEALAEGENRANKTIRPGTLALACALTLKGRLENRNGNLDQARKDLERAVGLRKQLSGQAFSEAYAELLANLASTYSMQGESEKAQTTLASGMAMVAGRQAPQFKLAAATLLQKKAEALVRTGQLNEAEKCLQQCLQLRSQLLTESHPLMADTKMACANLRNL